MNNRVSLGKTIHAPFYTNDKNHKTKYQVKISITLFFKKKLTLERLNVTPYI